MNTPSKNFYMTGKTFLEKQTSILSQKMGSVSKPSQTPWMVCCFAALLISTATLTITLGGKKPQNSETMNIARSSIDETAKLVNDHLEVENMIRHLQNITKHVHIAGTENNLKVAEYIRQQMLEQGLKNVYFNEYDVLLNYPNFAKPNKLKILDKDGNVVYKTTGLSDPLIEDEQNEIEGRTQWLAYSAPGEVEGDVVYVNKGTKQDYEILKNANIDVTGKIHIARHGTAFRGNIAKNAHKNGAIGLLIYSDPEIVAQLGTTEDVIYPKTDKMPGCDVERGGLYIGIGDPQTPDLPSIKKLYKSKSVKELQNEHIMPNIPVLPVPYENVEYLFSQMEGDNSIHKIFKGKLNVTYKYGPGLKDGQKVRINVESKFVTRTIQNVFGFIEGEVEPDRYVIVSNHYDAWTYGSIDPNSGTTALLEVSKALMKHQNTTGWKPYRSILFAHWDAEEFGLIGSGEFAQEYRVQLMRRAVGVVNMDIIGGNRTLNVISSPSIVNVIRSAAKRVEHPLKSEHTETSKSFYDSWKRLKPSRTPLSSEPDYMRPAGGSDHTSFYDYLGIPVITFVTSADDSAITYPLYHTLYETKFLSEKIVDTDHFKVHRSIAELFIDMALQLSDNEILPYDLHELIYEIRMDYVPSLYSALTSVRQRLAESYEIPLAQADFLRETVADLLTFIKSREFDKENSTVFEKITENDHLIEFEKCFISPYGQNGNHNARHLLYHPNGDNWYHNKALQQIFATISEIKQNPEASERLAKELANEIAQVTNALICAKHSLQTLFN